MTTPIDLNDLSKRLRMATPAERRRVLFEFVTELDDQALERLLIGGEKVPELSSRAIVHRLAQLLDLPIKETVRLLGFHESSLTRNKKVTVQLLDDVHSFCELLAKVLGVLELEDAQDWLKEPNPGLGGRRPYDLITTDYGRKKVGNLIESLLEGAIV